jgi:PAS domain S-box-containing protein
MGLLQELTRQWPEFISHVDWLRVMMLFAIMVLAAILWVRSRQFSDFKARTVGLHQRVHLVEENVLSMGADLSAKNAALETIVKKLEDAERERNFSDSVRQAIFEATGDALIVADESNRIIMANPAAHTMFGYTPGSLVHRRVVDLMPEKDREAHLDGVRRHIATGAVKLIGSTAHLMALHREGYEFEVEMTLTAFRVLPPSSYTDALFREASGEADTSQVERRKTLKAPDASEMRWFYSASLRARGRRSSDV